MAAIAIEPLPPFDYPEETIAAAAEQLLDHSAQLKFLTRRVTQLAQRQDTQHANTLKTAVELGRLSDRLTVSNSLAMLNARRLKKLLDHWHVEDVEDANIIESEAL